MTTVLPKRSKRFGIGKEIGGVVYVHRDYEDKLGDASTKAKQHLPESVNYHVVKLNQWVGAVSFIQCDDFDVVPEPTVGDIVTIDAEGNSRYRLQPRDPEIYHHKWLFVTDDYAGFDVEQSKQRSLAWSALEGVDRKKIGRKSYWEEFVAWVFDLTGSHLKTGATRMLLGKPFSRFVEKSPVSVVVQGTLERVSDPDKIQQVFDDNTVWLR